MFTFLERKKICLDFICAKTTTTTTKKKQYLEIQDSI